MGSFAQALAQRRNPLSRIAVTYPASLIPSRLISTFASAPLAPAIAISRATSKSDFMDAAAIAASCPSRSKRATVLVRHFQRHFRAPRVAV